MSCNCKSATYPGGEVEGVLVDSAEYFAWDSPSRPVAIDACIEKEIRALWAAGVWTGGSCCGHNLTGPSIVIATGSDGPRAKKLLEEIDPGRKWSDFSWRLVLE